MRERRVWATSVGFYLVYVAIVLWPIWAARVSPVWDGLDFNYPGFAFAAQALRSHRLPLWDPFTNCGMPFHADAQYAWYQPMAAILASIVPNSFNGYMIFWAAIYAWAGLGCLLLSREFGASPAGALIAAIAFSLSGFFVGHGEHIPYMVTGCWVPWVFALAHRALQRSSVSDAILTGVAFALSSLGGYPGLVVFESIALATWLGFLTPHRDGQHSIRRRVKWTLCVLLWSYALLVLVWSPALYSFLVLAKDYTERTSPVAAETALFGNPFTLRAALTFLFPKIAVSFPEFTSADLTMNDAYLGTLALPFAGAWFASRKPRPWALLAFVAFWFVISLGGAAGLRTLLYYLIPATRYMRHNAMLRVLFLAPLAAMAGAGATAILADERLRFLARRLLLGWLAVSMAGAALVYVILHARGIGAKNVVLPAPIITTLGIAILFWYRRPSQTRLATILVVALFAGDLWWHLRANSLSMWRDKSLLQRLDAYPRGADIAGPRRNEPDERYSSLHQVVRVPVVEGMVSLTSEFNHTLVRSRFETVLRTYRFWLSPSSALAPPIQQGLATLANTGVPGAVPTFVESPGDVLPGAPIAPGSFGEVRVVAYEPDRVELKVMAPGTGDAVLATTERTSAGWTVTVDGQPAQVLRVNYFFRGVHLGPGKHRVVFEYRAQLFKLLVGLSATTLLLATVLAAYFLLRQRTPPSGHLGLE